MCYYVANLHKIIETINLQMKKRYYLCNNVRENKMQVANMAGLLTKRGCVKTPKNSQSPDFPKPGLCYVQKFLYL